MSQIMLAMKNVPEFEVKLGIDSDTLQFITVKHNIENSRLSVEWGLNIEQLQQLWVIVLFY